MKNVNIETYKTDSQEIKSVVNTVSENGLSSVCKIEFPIISFGSFAIVIVNGHVAAIVERVKLDSELLKIARCNNEC